MSCKKVSMVVAASAAAIASLLVAGAAQAASFTYTKIADTATGILGSTGNFTKFDAPALDNGNVAFLGFGSDPQQGIYTDLGGSLRVVADTNTQIPGNPSYNGGIRNFSRLSDPSISDGKVAFAQLDPAGNSSGNLLYGGLFIDTGGSQASLINKSPIAAGMGIPVLSGPSLGNGNVAFLGGRLIRYSFNFEVDKISFDSSYSYSLTRVAIPAYILSGSPDPEATFIPDEPCLGCQFRGFGAPAIDGTSVAFRGFGDAGIRGIYTDLSGSLRAIANIHTAIPGGTGNFTDFGDPSFNNGSVAFVGTGESQSGVYTNLGDALNAVANTNATIPGGSGNFTSFLNPSLDNGNVTFLGFGSQGSQGIYTNLGGSLMKVVDTSNFLDGKTLSALQFGREGFSGNSIAFVANFTDGSSAVYRADAVLAQTSIPEPNASLGVLALGAFGIGSRLLGKPKKQKLTSSNHLEIL